MTFLLLLIPSLPATPTFWTFRRVSSIKYPSIYHNPPPSTPPPPERPFRLHHFAYCRYFDLTMGSDHVPEKTLCAGIYLLGSHPPTSLSTLHPPSTFCRSAIIAFSPSLFPLLSCCLHSCSDRIPGRAFS